MSLAASTHTSCTVKPRMSMPTMLVACCCASLRSLATLMPPALPRPPICTCALITHGYPISSAASTASSTEVAGRPEGTGTPWRANSCLPWYSSRSMREGPYRRAPGGRFEAQCRPHAAAEGHLVRHLRRLWDADRLGGGGLRRLPEGGRPRRLHAPA